MKITHLLVATLLACGVSTAAFPQATTPTAPAGTKEKPAAPADTKEKPAAPADTKEKPAAPADTKEKPAAPAKAKPATAPKAKPDEDADADKSALSAKCSAEATKRGLRGEPRKVFRRKCKRGKL